MNAKVNLKVNEEVKDNSLKAKSSLHQLNFNWVFWYASRKEADHHVPYDLRLLKVAEFSTLEDFFHYYLYIKPASEMDRNMDISIFKEGYKPLWENCTDGGCWFIRFKKNEDPVEIDLKWEKLIFALVGYESI